MLTLTVAEIKDLAEAAGLVLDKAVTYDDDELDMEYDIVACPKEGVRNDDGTPEHYKYVAYISDYADEGSYPLGAALGPDNAALCGERSESDTSSLLSGPNTEK